MIHELLEANFLSHIGDDQTKIEHLKATAQYLSNQVEKQPLKLIPLILIAFDPQTKPDEWLLIEVESELKKHWTTYHNKFKDERPVQLLRAIIIESLSQLANKKDYFAAVIWYVGVSYISPPKLSNEITLFHKFLKEIGEKVEGKAVKQWLLTFDHKLVKKNIEEITHQTTKISLNIAEIQNSFSGLWATDTVNTKSYVTIATAINTQFEAAISEVQENLEKPINELIKLVSIEILKNQLLWWKESKYSENLKQSYRELDNNLLVLTMAYDLHTMMTELYPHSVEYILKESLLQIISNNSEITIYEFVTNLINVLKGVSFTENHPVNSFEVFEGRNSLIGLIKICLSKGEVTQSDISEIMGLGNDNSYSLNELAIWCFRDMQAYRLIKILSSAKRRK